MLSGWSTAAALVGCVPAALVGCVPAALVGSVPAPHQQGPPVGVFPAERKLTDSWFVPEWSDKGMGGRSCKQLREVAASQPDLTQRGRASMLISHRCR
jgi:hypothetical protein